MPQYNSPPTVPGGAGMVTTGGKTGAYNITAATTSGAAGLKVGAGRLARIIVQTVPSAGNLTLNDLAVNTGAAAANQIFSVPFGSLVAGQVITLEWPFVNGLVVSSVGTGGVYNISFA